MSLYADYDDYLKANDNYKKAVKWNELLYSQQKDGNSTFGISFAHSKPPELNLSSATMLPSPNWDSPDALNRAILKVIIKNETKIIDKALDLLKAEMETALQKCQSFVDELQSKIDQAKPSR